ncbi:MAG: hypothetical protein IBJ00_03275 [Alphaproteobacteria bacterium]|nr:hypothetical protein [Alphaproteobacteria bacterium]
MARIVLICEYEKGLSHFFRLVNLAKTLKNENHEIYLVYNSPVTAKFLTCTDLFPILPSPRPPNWSFEGKTVRIGGYSDTLAMIGFKNANDLKALIKSWRALFDLICPSLIICDQAPTAALAAFDIISTLHLGDGFSLPPFISGDFPRLRADSPPTIKRKLLYDNIKSVQHDFHIRCSLETGEWGGKAGENQFICHIPELDIYLPYRNSYLSGPFFPLPQACLPLERKTFFAYLSGEYPFLDLVLVALVESKLQGEVVIPGLSKQAENYLLKHGIKVHHLTELTSFETFMAGKNLVIHHGGVHTAELAFALGTVQAIIPTSTETSLIGIKVQEAKCGKILPAHKSSISDITDFLLALSNQTDHMQWAEMKATTLFKQNYEPVFPKIIKLIYNLL